MLNRALPAQPDIEQYRKQAKELVKSCIRAAPEALERVRLHHPRLRRANPAELQKGKFKLADAQLIIAREHAFESWSQFTQHLQSPRANHPGSTTAVASRSERIPAVDTVLAADITGCASAAGLILFAHASGSQRHHPSHRYIAGEFQRASLATIQADLLTEEEELAEGRNGELPFDLPLLGQRIAAIADWIGHQPHLKELPLGCLASGTAAAGLLVAAAERPELARAIVSAGGRPDLAGPWIWRVRAPLLFIAGSRDTVGLGFTSSLLAPVPNIADRSLAVVENAHRVLLEPGALPRTAALARDWFRRHLS